MPPRYDGAGMRVGEIWVAKDINDSSPYRHFSLRIKRFDETWIWVERYDFEYRDGVRKADKAIDELWENLHERVTREWFLRNFRKDYTAGI